MKTVNSNIYKWTKRIFIVALVSFLSITSARADDPETPDGNNDDTLANETSVPFDGGVIWLTAAAIGYGVKEARKKKKEKEQDI